MIVKGRALKNLFATAKTREFTDIKQININNLKLRSIID